MHGAWIEAGFFISTGGKSPTREEGLLPPHLVTVSECIAEIYPDYWALPWAKATDEAIASVKEALQLDDPGLERLRKWVSDCWDGGTFGWPNVFYSQEVAQEFKDQFLPSSMQVQLLGLSLEESVAKEFLKEEAPQEGQGGSGVWTMLSQNKPLPLNQDFLGYEVLGVECGCSFHTAACNGLEVDYSRKLGISMNEVGLFDEYADAVKACDYTNLEDTGAEPVPWYPFRVDQYLF